MNFTQSRKQNQRIERISETTLVIGADIAKKITSPVPLILEDWNLENGVYSLTTLKG